LNNKGLVSISLVSAFRWKKSSDRDEWVAEGYSGRDSKASEDEVGEIAEDQVTNDGQGEEDVHDGAKSSDDQEFWGTGRSRSARMWSPKPAETRRPSTTYNVEDDSSNASDCDERDEPRDYTRGRRSQGPRYRATQEDDEQPWTSRDPRGGHPRYAESHQRPSIEHSCHRTVEDQVSR